jgi:hypothetical protein
MSYKIYLKQLYFDPEKPGSYGSVNKLYRAVRKEGKYVLRQIQLRDRQLRTVLPVLLQTETSRNEDKI